MLELEETLEELKSRNEKWLAQDHVAGLLRQKSL